MPISPSSFTITAVSPMLGMAQQARDQRRLAAAEEARDERDGDLAASAAKRADEPGSSGSSGAPGEALGLDPERAEVGDDRRARPCGRAGRSRVRPSRRARQTEVVEHRFASVATLNTRAAAPRRPARPSAVRASTPQREHMSSSVVAAADAARHGGGSMAKEIFCCIRRRRRRGRRLARLVRRRGLARRHLARPVRRRGRHAAAAQAVRAVRHEDDLVHPGHSIETFPEQTRRSSTPGHEIGMHGYTHENPIAMTPEQEEAVLVKCIDLIEGVSRPPADRLRGAVVGVLERHERAAAQARHQVRPQPDAQRLPPLLRPRRRHVDEDRLLEAGRGVDEAARARPGDRPDRDPGQLVPRRPAADDVHQGRAEQPRLRQPARHRADLDATSSTGSTASTTTRSSR